MSNFFTYCAMSCADSVNVVTYYVSFCDYKTVSLFFAPKTAVSEYFLTSSMPWVTCKKNLECKIYIICFLQESDKSQIFYWSSQTALGSGGCRRWLTMLKNLKTALFQTFSTWHRILSAFTALYWPSTAFYWPSTTKYQPVPPYTDPVPSWINHYRLILIQCHQVPTSRATYWPSTIMYQPVSPSSDPVPPSTEQYRLLLNQYHHISTSTAPYWPSTTKYQSIPTYTDPVPPSTNQYRLLLTQYHQVPTSTASHWPSTTKYQPVPPSTDPVPSYINQYRFILTQYHQVSTSTNLYCFCLGTTDSCTVYPGSCS